MQRVLVPVNGYIFYSGGALGRVGPGKLGAVLK